ncbi:hypothetical protein MCHI_003617 [Candidatus Magnetoovum chiemensis]|nr:hypothetical protein MCHI_003617 [Candidatus Magnetoovum chiemensis]
MNFFENSTTLSRILIFGKKKGVFSYPNAIFSITEWFCISIKC